MKVIPLNDKILVERVEAEEKTAGGIVLPDTAKEKPKQGKILELGDGKALDNGKRAAFQVKKGDKVSEGSLILLLEAGAEAVVAEPAAAPPKAEASKSSVAPAPAASAASAAPPAPAAARAAPVAPPAARAAADLDAIVVHGAHGIGPY